MDSKSSCKLSLRLRLQQLRSRALSAQAAFDASVQDRTCLYQALDDVFSSCIHPICLEYVACGFEEVALKSSSLI